MAKNVDSATVDSFSDEWTRFDQTSVDDEELSRLFEEYFHPFPWDDLPPDARGADIGCGTGRWAARVAPRVGRLHCVDASQDALDVARRTLAAHPNVEFHHRAVDALPFENDSLDFVYSLGVLHHVPDTASAIENCVRKLKPGAPALLYLYYAFDNRPIWFRLLWRVSDPVRRIVATLPSAARNASCDALAISTYWPLAKIARVAEWAGMNVDSWPLGMYRRRSFYTMRTDARDRFGTPLEKRFCASEIRSMMEAAGLRRVRFSDRPPYWCAVGVKDEESNASG